MELHERIAAEALALLGVPFRLHGRSALTGLDCVGLAALAVVRAGGRIGTLPDYRLRGTSLARAERALRAAGFVQVETAAPGTLLMARSGPMQLHLMIAAGAGLVHADAGLGRVVLMPALSPWPVLGRWRLTPSSGQD
ncbi:MAG TPA: peptidoglycan endopeptidase [Sphingobium sp.]|nr:peptidoglycan endopeptidase [Sphingobium sp.]